MDLFADLPCDLPPTLPFSLPQGEGYAASFLPDLQGWRLQVPDGLLLYVPQFFAPDVSDRALAFLQEFEGGDWRTTDWRSMAGAEAVQRPFKNIVWEQDHIKMYGKTIPLPRLTAWYGDAGAAYTYSGIKSEPKPWNKGLLYMKAQIEAVCHKADLAAAHFNSVLLNWYRSGEDALNWHADDEKELGTNPVIASVNFGQTRDFVLRRNADHGQKITVPLTHGSLMVMAGTLQHHWQHAVPVRKRVGGSRFNLTFRHIHGF